LFFPPLLVSSRLTRGNTTIESISYLVSQVGKGNTVRINPHKPLYRPSCLQFGCSSSLRTHIHTHTSNRRSSVERYRRSGT
jgi:hypothetical protein